MLERHNITTNQLPKTNMNKKQIYVLCIINKIVLMELIIDFSITSANGTCERHLALSPHIS